MKLLSKNNQSATAPRLATATGAVALLFAASACSGNPAAQPADVVARVADNVLTMTEVRAAMPAGLNPDDSARFVKAFVGTWVDSRVVSDIAAGEVDLAEIDRLTDEYRSSLIMQYYRRKMFENHAGTIPEDSLCSYYDAHKADYRLDRPMVKGIYLKVPDDAANLRRLRKLYVSDKPDDIDRLEKEVLSSAIHYDYFCDRWVDWEQIETRIPADFGADPSQWLASGGRRIDTSVGGFTYLLRITDVLPAGSTMPFGQARQLVLQRMLASNRRAYDAELIRSLREEAIKSGRVSIAVPE